MDQNLNSYIMMKPFLNLGYNFIYNTTSEYKNTLNKEVGSQDRHTIF
jgi:hypothetical protein